MTGAGDRVQTQFVGFALGIFAIGNDADALAFHVLKLRVATGEVEGDVLNPTNGAVLQQGIVFGHRADEGCLRLVGVDRNVCVGLLLRRGCRRLGGGSTGNGLGSWGAGRGRCAFASRSDGKNVGSRGTKTLEQSRELVEAHPIGLNNGRAGSDLTTAGDHREQR